MSKSNGCGGETNGIVWLLISESIAALGYEPANGNAETAGLAVVCGNSWVGAIPSGAVW